MLNFFFLKGNFDLWYEKICKLEKYIKNRLNECQKKNEHYIMIAVTGMVI